MDSNSPEHQESTSNQTTPVVDEKGMKRFVPAFVLTALAAIGIGVAINKATDNEIAYNEKIHAAPTAPKGSDSINPPGTIEPHVVINHPTQDQPK